MSKEPFVELVSPGHLFLRDLYCTDADGNIFEEYDLIRISRGFYYGPEKDDDKLPIPFRFSFLEGLKLVNDYPGLQIPSFALTCRILETLKRQGYDKEVKRFASPIDLEHSGFSDARILANTVINQDTNEIIHYPKNLNPVGSKTVVLPFKNLSIYAAKHLGQFRGENEKRFLQNLTGLEDPYALEEILNYRKPLSIGISEEVLTTPTINTWKRGNIVLTSRFLDGFYAKGFRVINLKKEVGLA